MYYVTSNGIKTAVILPDPDPSNPRDSDYQTNITKMICWHSRRNLGDKHSYRSPLDFAQNMASKYLQPKDVMAAVVNGDFADFRATDNGNGSYDVEAKIGFIPGTEKWTQMEWAIDKDTFEVIEGEATFDLEMDVLDNCYPDEILKVCEKSGNVAVLPLYLYDHSGISISTGSFVGRAHHAEWDSGQVGYIYMDKETAIEQMSLVGDKINLAMPFPYEKSIFVDRTGSEDMDIALFRNGYTPVRVEDIKNIDKPRTEGSAERILDPERIKDSPLYKKDRTLYVFEGYLPNNSIILEPLATFNPELQRLTDETWKDRALEALEADVVEYDNYLTGEVYGYQCFEGLDEVESCWGFNPGKEDIQDLMSAELGGWYGAEPDFEEKYEDDFDIEEFFDENEFPELWEEITKRVVTLLYEDFQVQDPFPYAMSFADIRANKNEVLENIVQDLYDAHKDPTVVKIREAVFEHAGVARELQPKLSVQDLDPEKDYTASELMTLLQKKPSLEDMISAAQTRAIQKTPDTAQKDKNNIER